MADLLARLTLQDHYSAELRRAEGAFGGFGRSLEGLVGGFRMLAGAAGAYFGLATGRELVGKAVDAAVQQEEAVHALTVAMERYGAAAVATVPQQEAFASALQRTTRYGDEAIMAVQAMLLNSGVLPEQLQAATLATANLAAVMGVDLPQAAATMQSAMSGRAETLRRYGLELTAGVKGTEALAEIVGQVNEKFAGRAQADLGTYAAAVAQARNAWGDLLEGFGEGITKSEGLKRGLAELAAGLGEASDRIKAIRTESLGDSLGAAVPKAGNLAVMVLSLAEKIAMLRLEFVVLKTVVQSAWDVTVAVMRSITMAVAFAVDAVTGGVSYLWELAKGTFAEVVRGVAEAMRQVEAAARAVGMTEIADKMRDAAGAAAGWALTLEQGADAEKARQDALNQLKGDIVELKAAWTDFSAKGKIYTAEIDAAAKVVGVYGSALNQAKKEVEGLIAAQLAAKAGSAALPEVPGFDVAAWEAAGQAKNEALRRSEEDRILSAMSTEFSINEIVMSAGLQRGAWLDAELEAFKGTEEQKLAFVRQKIRERMAAEHQAAALTFQTYGQLFSAVSELVAGNSEKQLGITKALAVAETIANGIAAGIRAYKDLGPIAGSAAAAAIAAIVVSSVSRIRAITMGGGGSSGAPALASAGEFAAASTQAAAPSVPAGGIGGAATTQRQDVSITLNGLAVVQDQAQLARVVADLVAQAQGQLVAAPAGG